MKTLNNNFLKLSFSFMLIFSGILKDLKAEDAQEKEYKTMEQMMGEIRLEKKQVELMIDKMVISGRFSTDEGAKAKRELASMKESDLESLKTAAISQVKSKKLFDQ